MRPVTRVELFGKAVLPLNIVSVSVRKTEKVEREKTKDAIVERTNDYT